MYFCLNANEKKAENLVAVMIIYTESFPIHSFSLFLEKRRGSYFESRCFYKYVTLQKSQIITKKLKKDIFIENSTSLVGFLGLQV